MMTMISTVPPDHKKKMNIVTKKSRTYTGIKEREDYRDRKDEEKVRDKGKKDMNITFHGERGKIGKRRQRSFYNFLFMLCHL